MHRNVKGLWNGNIHTFQTLPSTNKWVMDNIEKYSHGDVVWALKQTDGKGRFKREWIADKDKSLTFSACVNMSMIHESIEPIITHLAAISVQTAMSSYGITAMLKWPNDVLCSGKKISGILLEKDLQSNSVIIGIGVNVNHNIKDFSALQLKQPATSMCIETDKSFIIADVLETILINLEKNIETASSTPDFVATHWRNNDYLHGKKISINTINETFTGEYAGISNSGQLLMNIRNEKEVTTFWAGDVTILHAE